MIDKSELTKRDRIFDTYTEALEALKHDLVQDAEYSVKHVWPNDS